MKKLPETLMTPLRALFAQILAFLPKDRIQLQDLDRIRWMPPESDQSAALVVSNLGYYVLLAHAEGGPGCYLNREFKQSKEGFAGFNLMNWPATQMIGAPKLDASIWIYPEGERVVLECFNYMIDSAGELSSKVPDQDSFVVPPAKRDDIFKNPLTNAILTAFVNAVSECAGDNITPNTAALIEKLRQEQRMYGHN